MPPADFTRSDEGYDYMKDFTRILFFETWWTWARNTNEPYSWTDFACRGFNFVEAAAWIIFAGLVFVRWRRCRKSNLELWYMLAFTLFGVSDLTEAWVVTSWLLWWKAVNLVGLFYLRRTVMRRFYPDARVF